MVISVLDEDHEIPALPAADWLRVLMDDRSMFEDLFLELIPTGPSLLLDKRLADELESLSKDIIELASGRKWYIAMRMIVLMRANWNVLGATMLRKGVDASSISLSGWLDVALLVTLEHIEKDNMPMFLAQLELPPEGEGPPEEEMEMTGEQFLSLMG